MLPLLCAAAAADADAAAAAFAALLLWGASVKAGATVALLERATSDGALDRLRDAGFLRSAAEAEFARRVLRRLEKSYWTRAFNSPIEVYADWSARDEEPAQGLRRESYFRRFRKELFMTGSTSGSGDKSSSWISGSIPTSGPGSGQINIPQSGLFGGVRPGTPVQARERHPASSFAVVALFAFVGLVVAIRVFGRDRGADVANALRVIDNVVDASR